MTTTEEPSFIRKYFLSLNPFATLRFRMTYQWILLTDLAPLRMLVIPVARSPDGKEKEPAGGALSQEFWDIKLGIIRGWKVPVSFYLAEARPAWEGWTCHV